MKGKGRLCLMVSDFDAGGVERTFANLAAGLSTLGVKIDLLIGRSGGPYLEELPQEVRVLARQDVAADRLLRDYLGENRPDVLLTGKLEDDFAAVRVKREFPAAFRLFFQVGTPLSHLLKGQSGLGFKRYLRRTGIRRHYREADGIIAVSEGVAEDLVRHFGVPRDKLQVLNNPVLPGDFTARRSEPCPHPWFVPGAPPVILSVGGLRKVKDFATLVRAFGRVRQNRDCRLVILGEGRQRGKLLRVGEKLGIREDLDLPGFVENPYPHMAGSAVFVLSSRREGFGNVLVEALGAGIPVVSTDCPCGPREILQGGRLGRLAPVGNARELADAILETLTAPPDPDLLKESVEPFTLETACRKYLQALGLHDHG